MTRMWMVPVEIMCRNHLLGEHKEVHQLLGTLKKKMRIDGYINHNCVEPKSIEARHFDLVVEMKKRGMNHNSEILDNCGEVIDYLPTIHKNFQIDSASSLNDLLNRCPRCKQKFMEIANAKNCINI